MWGKASGGKERTESQGPQKHREEARGPAREEAQPWDGDARPRGDSACHPPSPQRRAAEGLTPQGTDQHPAAGRHSETTSAGRWSPTSESQALPGPPRDPWATL